VDRTNAADTGAPSADRIWINRQGVQIEAEFLGVEDGKVRLKKKDDGNTYSVSLENLSGADQRYVQQQAARNSEPLEKTRAKAETLPAAEKPAEHWATFVNRRNGKEFKGKIIEQDEVREGRRLRVETPDRQTGYLWASQWIIRREKTPSAGAGNAAVPSIVSPQSPGQAPRNVVDLDTGMPATRATTAAPQVKDIVVTGVGTDPDKALQNAFSQAIEQTVGVMVDAESVVKNDQLIRDEVLTYSRGYVEKFDVVSKWEEGGLHHAKIRATVERGKLAEKLRGMKIAVQEVAGELASRQIEFDATNEEQAAEMFRKALTEFSMVKLTKVEIVGKPEITRTGGNARVAINVRISPDIEQWQKFAPSLLTILTKTAVRRASYTLPTDYYNDAVRQQLEDKGVVVAVLANAVDNRTRWDVFRVPEPMEAAITATVSRIRCKLVCALFDENGKEVARTHEPWVHNGYYGVHVCAVTEETHRQWWFVGPAWYAEVLYAVADHQCSIDVSAEDLRRVVKAASFLEEHTEK
jgi:hypothetical protein